MAAPAPTATAVITPTGTATADALVARVAREADDLAVTDVHTSDPTTSTTTLTVATDATTRNQVGDILSWPVGSAGAYEAAVLTAVAATTLTVRRAQFGTTAVDHAANAVFRVNPLYLDQVIYDAIVEALEGLYDELFQVQVSTYTTATDLWWALPATAETVVEAYQVDGTPENKIVLAFEEPRLTHTGFAASNRVIRVRGISDAIASFYIISTTRLVLTTLTTVQQNIVVYEAAARLLENQATRANRQSESFVFDASTKVQLLRRRAAQMIENERQRLDAYLPQRDRIGHRFGHHFREM